mmetsp:Transcript_13866/g.19859  ORF Transcript_13866/g.19859 Transcript_13866/m.19859 type:complete len:133 (+) Transcript_13866:1-399(+)
MDAIQVVFRKSIFLLSTVNTDTTLLISNIMLCNVIIGRLCDLSLSSTTTYYQSSYFRHFIKCLNDMYLSVGLPLLKLHKNQKIPDEDFQGIILSMFENWDFILKQERYLDSGMKNTLRESEEQLKQLFMLLA